MARRFLKVSTATGNITETYQWGDDRDFPSNAVVEAGFTIMEVDPSVNNVDINYHTDFKGNFILNAVPANQAQIDSLKAQLQELDSVLPRVMEDTWATIGIDETTLPQICQDRLAQKRSLRSQLQALL